MVSRLVHPKLLETLTRDFFPQSCSIQQAVKTQSTSGQEVKTWADVPGWTAIPCRMSASGGGERRMPSETYAEITNRIVLAGAFNGLNSEMRAVVNGTSYDIILVEPASEGITTRLSVRLVK